MSSVSHSVSFHLCGGEIENMSIFGHAETCTMHDNGCDDRADSHQSSFDHNGCCKDTNLVIDTDKYLSKATEKVTFENLLNVSIAVVDRVQSISYTEKEYAHTSIYKPPLINRDITILVQSFLI
jgi:hypothetical protein